MMRIIFGWIVAFAFCVVESELFASPIKPDYSRLDSTNRKTTGRANNYGNGIIGYVGSHGEMLTTGGNSGNVGIDGNIRKKDGMIMGAVVPPDRELIFDGDKVVGSLDANGNFYDTSGVKTDYPIKGVNGSSGIRNSVKGNGSENRNSKNRDDKKNNTTSDGVVRKNGANVNTIEPGLRGSIVDTYSCEDNAPCKTTKTISNDGKAGWHSQNEAAYQAAEQLFIDGQCFLGQDKEAALLVLKKGSQYFYGYKSEYVNRSDAYGSAPVPLEKYRAELEAQGYSVVGIIHNHPLSKPGEHTVFSDADKNSARSSSDGRGPVDCYMVSCDDSSMGVNGSMRLYRYVKDEDKAYVVSSDGRQTDAPEYIKGEDGGGGENSSTVLNNGKTDSSKAGQQSVSIDTSTLEALIKKWIEFVQSLLDAGEKATDAQLSTYNSYAEEAKKELIRLLRPIQELPISDAEKVKIANDRILRKLKSPIERLQALQKQLISRGLVGGFKSVSLDDFRLSATGSDEARKLDSPSDKPTSNKSNTSQNRSTQGDSQRNGFSPQGKTTAEDVSNALREDGSGIEAVSTLLR